MSRRASVNERGHVVGQDHHRARFTDHDVWLMHELHDAGLGYLRIARKFETSKATVQAILKGRRRSHVVTGDKRLPAKPRRRFRPASPHEFDEVCIGQD